MISSDTPIKLAEIIRDTWPQLFHLKGIKTVSKNDDKYTNSTDKGVV
jgi:hypothetical protein